MIEYKRGYSDSLLHGKHYNLANIKHLKTHIQKQIDEGSLMQNAYVMGVLDGLTNLKLRIEIAIQADSIPKNSHIVALIESCNMLWKRNSV